MDKLLFPHFFWHWIFQIFLIGLMTRTRKDANDQQLKWPCCTFKEPRKWGCLKFYETYKSIKSSSMSKLYFKVFQHEIHTLKVSSPNEKFNRILTKKSTDPELNSTLSHSILMVYIYIDIFESFHSHVEHSNWYFESFHSHVEHSNWYFESFYSHGVHSYWYFWVIPIICLAFKLILKELVSI